MNVIYRFLLTVFVASTSTFFVASALAQGVAGEPISETNWIVVGIVSVVMLGAGWALRAVQSQTESWAAPRRDKPLHEQTAADKALIELDKKVDLINIDILERFTRSFVLARLPSILAKVPSLGPIIIAGELAQDAMKEWQHRNPETQRDMRVTLEAMKGKLAGAVGEQTRDVLTEALIKSGVPKEWTDAATKDGDAIGTGNPPVATRHIYTSKS